MQDLFFLIQPSSFYATDDISWKTTRLVMNRFTIDEDAAFELLGVTDGEKLNRSLLNKIKHTNNLHIFATESPHTASGKSLSETICYMFPYMFELYVSKQFLGTSQARSVMITRMYMCRHFLITKEKMEDMCKGQGLLKESVTDDIEALFADLQLGYEYESYSSTYFLPKLTSEEKELVQKKDSNYLETFSSLNPSIDDDEMKSSESKSMYVRGWCTRDTYIIENPMFQDEDVSNMPVGSDLCRN